MRSSASSPQPQGATCGGVHGPFDSPYWFSINIGAAATSTATATAAAAAAATATASTAADASAAAALAWGSAWGDEWKVWLERWWPTLSLSHQSALGNCLGAWALHMGSRVDGAKSLIVALVGGGEGGGEGGGCGRAGRQG